MKFDAKKIDEANIEVSATLEADAINNKVDKIAKQAAKTMDIQGFRKGKVPTFIVKKRYGEKLLQDAQGELLNELITETLKKFDIEISSLIGEPIITKLDKQDNDDVEVAIQIAVKPEFDLGDYKALLPEIKTKKVTAKEIDARISELASSSSPLVKIKRKRMVRDKDFVVIDFEGFKDGVAFEGGKAEKYTLEIGSGSFIPGFEEQIIGMKYDEEKEITVTFPQDYQAKDLAGAEVIFKVKLHEIQEKGEAVIDDEFAKKMLPQEKDATVDTLKEKIKEQLKTEKTNKYYNEELKPAYIENLVKNIDFAVPASILEREISQIINNNVRDMSEDEIKALQEDAKKIEKMKKEATPDATKSVKATFIIDALAKAENVDVTDQEVTQTIYYEAMMSGQDAQSLIKQYEKMGYLPAIKMSMIEQKVITKLLDEKAGK